MHATQHGFCDPRQNHHTKKSKSQKLSPFPRNASNPYYWEKNKKNKAVREILKVKAARVAKAGEKKGGKKQKQRVAVGSDSEFEFGKNCEFKLLKPPTAFEAELQSDVESDAEFRSWPEEELQKELPANGGGGEETSQEEALRLCREDAARFKDVEFFKADAAADRSLFLNTAWLALARSAGLEEWLACARSEGLFCECCLR